MKKYRIAATFFVTCVVLWVACALTFVWYMWQQDLDSGGSWMVATVGAAGVVLVMGQIVKYIDPRSV